jgi:hypothetical protein
LVVEEILHSVIGHVRRRRENQSRPPITGNMGGSSTQSLHDVSAVVVGVMVTWWAAWYFSRSKYELSYAVVRDSLMDALMPAGADAVLTVDGHAYGNPRFLEIHVANTGKEEFVPEDFEQPVVFSIADKAWNVRVAATSDGGVAPQILPAHEDGSIPVGFEPLLLKPGEWFLLSAVADHGGIARGMHVSTRIRNIKELNKLTEVPERRTSVQLDARFALVVTSAFALLATTLAVILTLTNG